jgi:hypothetical protein
MILNRKECDKAEVDPKAVASIARRIESACRDADCLGITVFMGSFSSLRFHDGGDRHLILAHLQSLNCDGGDGAYETDSDGYERGE